MKFSKVSLPTLNSTVNKVTAGAMRVLGIPASTTVFRILKAAICATGIGVLVAVLYALFQKNKTDDEQNNI